MTYLSKNARVEIAHRLTAILDESEISAKKYRNMPGLRELYYPVLVGEMEARIMFFIEELQEGG